MECFSIVDATCTPHTWFSLYHLSVFVVKTTITSVTRVPRTPPSMMSLFAQWDLWRTASIRCAARTTAEILMSIYK